jgi:hypothetical protein
VEFGFRGVSYNLMNLNPLGRSPENFLVNPVAPAGTVGTTMMDRSGPGRSSFVASLAKMLAGHAAPSVRWIPR